MQLVQEYDFLKTRLAFLSGSWNRAWMFLFHRLWKKLCLLMYMNSLRLISLLILRSSTTYEDATAFLSVSVMASTSVDSGNDQRTFTDTTRNIIEQLAVTTATNMRCNVSWIRGRRCRGRGTGWDPRGKRTSTRWIDHHGDHRPRSSSEMGFSGTRCSTETLVAGAQVFGDMTQAPLCAKMVSSCTSHFLSVLSVESLADQFSEEQICSSQGFDLIIGAIRNHFRSYLEAEPEVKAEVALYQTT